MEVRRASGASGADKKRSLTSSLQQQQIQQQDEEEVGSPRQPYIFLQPEDEDLESSSCSASVTTLTTESVPVLFGRSQGRFGSTPPLTTATESTISSSGRPLKIGGGGRGARETAILSSTTPAEDSLSTSFFFGTGDYKVTFSYRYFVLLGIRILYAHFIFFCYF